MKKPGLSFWDVRLSWVDGAVCALLAALAMAGSAAASPLGRKLLAKPGFDPADFLVYMLISYWGYFIVTFTVALLLARARRWVSQRKKG